MKKRIVVPLVLYLIYSNVAFMIKSIETLTIRFLDVKWATEKDTTIIICDA